MIVAFDLSDVETLRHARKWKEDACESAKDPFVFLVGTKKDIVVCIIYQLTSKISLYPLIKMS